MVPAMVEPCPFARFLDDERVRRAAGCAAASRRRHGGSNDGDTERHATKSSTVAESARSMKVIGSPRAEISAGRDAFSMSGPGTTASSALSRGEATIGKAAR